MRLQTCIEDWCSVPIQNGRSISKIIKHEINNRNTIKTFTYGKEEKNKEVIAKLKLDLTNNIKRLQYKEGGI